jgi:hypothetical protein
MDKHTRDLPSLDPDWQLSQLTCFSCFGPLNHFNLGSIHEVQHYMICDICDRSDEIKKRTIDESNSSDSTLLKIQCIQNCYAAPAKAFNIRLFDKNTLCRNCRQHNYCNCQYLCYDCFKGNLDGYYKFASKMSTSKSSSRQPKMRETLYRK